MFVRCQTHQIIDVANVLYTFIAIMSLSNHSVCSHCLSFSIFPVNMCKSSKLGKGGERLLDLFLEARSSRDFSREKKHATHHCESTNQEFSVHQEFIGITPVVVVVDVDDVVVASHHAA
mmetsp:Transcript_14747/g.35461  ORF Transcript_14747/g.35461 Transcript_14747/m.35461 type:complete len:119 (-) Transcript_14747:439-795(-)